MGCCTGLSAAQETCGEEVLLCVEAGELMPPQFCHILTQLSNSC